MRNQVFRGSELPLVSSLKDNAVSSRLAVLFEVQNIISDFAVRIKNSTTLQKVSLRLPPIVNRKFPRNANRRKNNFYNSTVFVVVSRIFPDVK